MVARKLTKLFLALAAGVAVAVALAVITGMTAVSSTPAVAGVPLAAPAPCAPGANCVSATNYYQPIFVSSYASFAKRWAEVSGRGVYSDREACMTGTAARFAAPSPPPSCTVTAWRWNGYSWVQTTRRIGTYVWVEPFATGWSWTWTSGAGWLAMRDEKLVARWEPMMIAT
jgi:hypothetical protein